MKKANVGKTVAKKAVAKKKVAAKNGVALQVARKAPVKNTAAKRQITNVIPFKPAQPRSWVPQFVLNPGGKHGGQNWHNQTQHEQHGRESYMKSVTRKKIA